MNIPKCSELLRNSQWSVLGDSSPQNLSKRKSCQFLSHLLDSRRVHVFSRSWTLEVAILKLCHHCSRILPLPIFHGYLGRAGGFPWLPMVSQPEWPSMTKELADYWSGIRCLPRWENATWAARAEGWVWKEVWTMCFSYGQPKRSKSQH